MSDADRPTLLSVGGTNAIGRMLGLLGDEWTLLLLQQALSGSRRYGQFLEALPISNAVLSTRLATLTEADLFERIAYQRTPPRSEYLLTARGRALWPVLLTIWDWERRWVDQHASGLPAMHHTVCNHDFAPVLSCGTCRMPVHARDLDVAWGPSGSWARSVPQAATRRRPESDAARPTTGLFPDTMAIFGNRWASSLMGAAFRGLTRFTDIAAALGAPPTVVADRLRAFCALGVLEPTSLAGRHDRVEYHLTDKGHAFYPVVATSLQWAHDWFHAPEGPALLQTHRACSSPLVATLTCDRCDAVLAGADVIVVPTDRTETVGAT